MTEPRVLTDSELDLVSGGLMKVQPVRSPEPLIVKLVKEIIVDVLKILEGNNGRQQQRAA